MSEEELTDEARAELRRKAAENVARIQAERQASEITQAGELTDALMAMAEKATGLSRAELLAIEPVQYAPAVQHTPNAALVALGRMKRAGVPERHAEHLSASPRECDALAFVRDFLASGKDILILSGGLGTQKTGSACWALSQQEGGVFVKAKHLLKIEIEDKAFSLRLARAKLVVLDDLGTETPDEKGYWQSTFNDLFDDWYANKARVIVTCNITREQFKERYDARIYDRLREAGKWCDVGGESVRGK